ncbi:DUF1097 domain-containing protein [Nocardioides rubriscoriae]|uniref:DUF1097 domain-containing protein n=1 Tax=Nocardioides rubriscoriae TaxID=642762 RepID=UPI0011DF64E5|nr:DUF1097 domain-containing protein [Nocardioides rubriscoriae]
MKVPVASALVVGLVGVVITYLYVGPFASLGLLVPATFLGAASYFAAGGTTATLASSTATNVWGIVCGTVALVMLSHTTSDIVVALIVGGMTAVFILGSLVDALGFVPGSVIGFATTVLFGLLTGASGTDFSLPTGPFTVMLISFLVGNAYGWAGSQVVPRVVAATTTGEPAPATA